MPGGLLDIQLVVKQGEAFCIPDYGVKSVTGMKIVIVLPSSIYDSFPL